MAVPRASVRERGGGGVGVVGGGGVAQERKNSRMEEWSLQFTESGSKKIKQVSQLTLLSKQEVTSPHTHTHTKMSVGESRGPTTMMMLLLTANCSLGANSRSLHVLKEPHSYQYQC